ncbi:RES domain-containing protein [Crossiella sp. CA-258035]|uniref:RES domain-containing protein n=1 Tax=Crossiella sp. CA-258035 TaxID=2981138 RepID=UPI0024BCAE52|nr:RES domain-containing protein [Crossiella sp. CA-258035]WHT16156.1 RES domain-containing protein [Crossiella sp. CA-258035]
MARLPPPPPHVQLRSLVDEDRDVHRVPPGQTLYRVFTAGGSHSALWNTFRVHGPLPHARFDAHPGAPDGSVREALAEGAVYYSTSLLASMATVYQSTSIVDRRTRSPFVVAFRPARTLRLLDLSGLWPVRAGTSLALSTGPTKVTQSWARAIREACPHLDGLWYRTVMAPLDHSVCLWDPPAAPGLPDEPDLLLPLSDPRLDEPLTRICAELNYTLLS